MVQARSIWEASEGKCLSKGLPRGTDIHFRNVAVSDWTRFFSSRRINSAICLGGLKRGGLGWTFRRGRGLSGGQNRVRGMVGTTQQTKIVLFVSDVIGTIRAILKSHVC
jgi:hypothetical protein